MQALTTSITLTEPMRSCVVAPQIIAAARDIEAILEAAKLDDTKFFGESDEPNDFRLLKLPNEISRLKKIVTDVNEARVSSFREIEEVRAEFKSQIDEKILKPLNDKITEYETKIREHNAEVRRQEIASAISKTEVVKPIPPAIKVRQKAHVCECIDLSKVPESYKLTIFNQQKADADVRCGLRELAGCRIYRPK